MARRSSDKYWWRFPRGESYERGATRASLALGRVATEGSRRPLLVTHEMTGRMLLKVLLDLDPAEALAQSLAFGAVTAVSPTARDFTEVRARRPAIGPNSGLL
jgi:probable phosphoglycerate mutase